MSTTISGSESSTTEPMTSGPIEGTTGSESTSGPDPDGSSSGSSSSGMTFFASIGAGPWFNAAGDMLAADLDALHARGFEPNDMDGLIVDENGAAIPGNEHDILTGSAADGTVQDGATCDDWTSASPDGAARVGHSDIPSNPEFSRSWNSAHDAPGCDADSLASVGGAGRLYCFAID
ncbi:MAG: hypothetical protein IAG13_23165 [Deltaproteobacteria bacterium]|nr:hypothetical protein [Nannocystaceae bacterium]